MALTGKETPGKNILLKKNHQNGGKEKINTEMHAFCSLCKMAQGQCQGSNAAKEQLGKRGSQCLPLSAVEEAEEQSSLPKS